MYQWSDVDTDHANSAAEQLAIPVTDKSTVTARIFRLGTRTIKLELTVNGVFLTDQVSLTYWFEPNGLNRVLDFQYQRTAPSVPSLPDVICGD